MDICITYQLNNSQPWIQKRRKKNKSILGDKVMDCLSYINYTNEFNFNIRYAIPLQQSKATAFFIKSTPLLSSTPTHQWWSMGLDSRMDRFLILLLWADVEGFSTSISLNSSSLDRHTSSCRWTKSELCSSKWGSSSIANSHSLLTLFSTATDLRSSFNSSAGNCVTSDIFCRLSEIFLVNWKSCWNCHEN